MDYKAQSEAGIMQVALSGQLTFADNLKFRHVLDLLDDETLSAMIMDFSSLDFIDSAGLGMLLLLRDECQARNVTLTISGAHGQVHKIFAISKFDQIFTFKNTGSHATHH